MPEMMIRVVLVLAVLAMASGKVQNTFKPLSVCTNQNHFFGSAAYAIPEYTDPKLEGVDEVRMVLPPSAKARHAMCDVCSNLFKMVFKTFRELELGVTRPDNVRGVESVLKPPHHLCDQYRDWDRFANPRPDYEDHSEHMVRKKRAYCERLVGALQQQYGYARGQEPGQPVGGNVPSPDELQTPTRVRSFNAAVRRIFRRISESANYTPDMSLELQAGEFACHQLQCC
eukprot:TRINITY_DN34439_c0_g1_i1.p1 TRINITY_DN34439_c0_g1~~TRINITY_DN34439_c0_g1_i1.p1  ORF type:complete len:228 (+),score=42.38 TRINITY_DN34439_c0_g1_i1:194-877(+)